jgi:hypothetical protein
MSRNLDTRASPLRYEKQPRPFRLLSGPVAHSHSFVVTRGLSRAPSPLLGAACRPPWARVPDSRPRDDAVLRNARACRLSTFTPRGPATMRSRVESRSKLLDGGQDVRADSRVQGNVSPSVLPVRDACLYGLRSPELHDSEQRIQPGVRVLELRSSE